MPSEWEMYRNANLGGDYARDTHRDGFGDNYGRGPKNYRRSDERIADDVCDCLTAADDVDATDIDLKVEDCVVTLTGRVRTRYEKRRAEDIAASCAGVHDVMNALRVSASDDEVEIGKASE